jgi:hypothetical protein
LGLSTGSCADDRLCPACERRARRVRASSSRGSLSTGRVWRCWQHLSDRCRALLDNRQNCELTRGDAEVSKLLIEDRSRNLMGAADEKARQKLQFIRDVLGIPSPLNRLPGWRPQCPAGFGGERKGNSLATPDRRFTHHRQTASSARAGMPV